MELMLILQPAVRILLAPNQWQHITLVFTGTKLRFYSNGYFEEEVNAPYTFYNSATDLIIGAYTTTDLRGLVGYLDELSLYNVSLDDDQVLQIYNYVTSEKYATIPEPTSFILLVLSLLFYKKIHKSR